MYNTNLKEWICVTENENINNSPETVEEPEKKTKKKSASKDK